MDIKIVSLQMMEPRHIPDAFRGLLNYEDYIESTDLELYLLHISQRTIEHVERNLWQSMDKDAFDPMHYEAKTMYFSRIKIRVYKDACYWHHEQPRGV